MNNTIKLGLVGIETETAPAYMAADFEAELTACDPTETVYIDIHSEGGSVFEGYRMANAIEDWPGHVVGRIKVAAFSIASYIAMKCDEIEIAKNGFFMIHNPYTRSEGDDEALARDAKLLAEMKAEMVETYVSRTGISADDITAIMKKETYFGAVKSVEAGLADRIIEPATGQKQLPTNHMPSFVFAAMYAQSEAVSPAKSPGENPMSDKLKTPVAASVKLIKAKYPKALDAFIVKAMDEEMDMEEVTEEYAKSMEETVAELQEQVAVLTAKAMEEEEIKAKAMEEEEVAKAKAMDDEKETAPAAKSGVSPVAHAGGIAATPKAKWDSAIEAYVAKGKSRQQAVVLANRNNPGLREQLLNN